jgi:segregation and condensation protein A
VGVNKLRQEKDCFFQCEAYSPPDMFGLKLTFALLAATYLFARKSWAAFGRGDVMNSVPGPQRLTRLDRWIASVDWEKVLGLRHDLPTPLVPTLAPIAPSSHKRPEQVAPTPEQTPALASVQMVNLADLLTGQPVGDPGVHEYLSTQRRTTSSSSVVEVTVVIHPSPAAPTPISINFIQQADENLIPLHRVVYSAPFAVIDEDIGQPVGAPDVIGLDIVSRARETPSPVRFPQFFIRHDREGENLSAFDYQIAASRRPGREDELAITDAASEDQIAAAESGFEDLPAELLAALADDESTQPDPNILELPLQIHIPGWMEAGQPVGAPDVFSNEPQPLSGSIIAAEFSSPSYRVAAYSLTTAENNGPTRNAETGEEFEPEDPPEDILAALPTDDPAPVDPNVLELPLDRHSPAELLAGQPVGAPDVFDILLAPKTVPAQEVASADDDDASAPLDFAINRISERVEMILSNALARPAPAINFKDTLADLEKSKAKKKKEDPAERLPSAALEHNLAQSEDREGGLNMAEYKVQFEIFEGPLDLLLYLVRKQEVDIYEVNLTYIAEEFIQYIDMMRTFDLEIAGEFLVMAASLILIKSKELLPVDQQAQVEDEEEQDDPRWELIRQLVEYRKFKDASADFKKLELAQEDIFARNPPKPEFEVKHIKPNLSVFDLLGAVNKILERIDAKEEREIFADRWTVSEKIELIRDVILKEHRVMFTALFEDALSRTEVVATFLALLELIKLKAILVEQTENFSDIEICEAPPEHHLTNPDAEPPLPTAAAEPAAAEFDLPDSEED